MIFLLFTSGEEMKFTSRDVWKWSETGSGLPRNAADKLHQPNLVWSSFSFDTSLESCKTSGIGHEYVHFRFRNACPAVTTLKVAKGKAAYDRPSMFPSRRSLNTSSFHPTACIQSSVNCTIFALITKAHHVARKDAAMDQKSTHHQRTSKFSSTTSSTTLH